MEANKVLAQKQRITYLDLLRGIAILAVVTIHVTSYPVAFLSMDSTVYPLYFILNAASQFAVPAFLFLSSLVLFYRYDGGVQGNWLLFYWKRLKRILLPYLFWSVYYSTYLSYIQHISFSDGLRKFLRGLPLGGSYDHLYFMIIIAQFYVLFPLLSLLFQKIGQVRRHPILVGAVLQIAFYLLNYYVLHMHKTGTFVMTYFVYFFLGAYMAERLKGLSSDETPKWNYRWTALFLGSAMLFIVQKWLQLASPHWIRQPFLSNINFITDYAYCSIACVFLVLFVRILEGKPRLQKVLFSLGSCAFGIYFIHPYFLILWRHFVMTSGPIAYHLLTWAGGAAALAASWLITWLLMHTPLGVYLVGESKWKARNNRGASQSGTM